MAPAHAGFSAPRHRQNQVLVTPVPRRPGCPWRGFESAGKEGYLQTKRRKEETFPSGQARYSEAVWGGMRPPRRASGTCGCPRLETWGSQQGDDDPQEEGLFNAKGPGFPLHQWESGACWGSNHQQHPRGKGCPNRRCPSHHLHKHTAGVNPCPAPAPPVLFCNSRTQR